MPSPATCAHQRPRPHFRAFDNLNTTDYYATAGAALPGQSGGNFNVQAWIIPETTAVSATRTWLCCNSSAAATGGWLFVSRLLNATIEFACASSVPAFVFAPVYTLLAGDYGRPMHVHGWHDGTNVRMAVNGVQVGSGTAITGYTVASTVVQLGARTASAQSASGTIQIAGAAGGFGTPTVGELAEAYRAGLQSGDIVAVPAKTSSLWSAKALGSAGATLVDSIGGANASRTGSPTYSGPIYV